MLLLKMMSGEDKPDSNTSKSFKIIQIADDESVHMDRLPSGLPCIRIHKLGTKSCYEVVPEGNSYLMDGKTTVATYTFNKYLK